MLSTIYLFKQEFSSTASNEDITQAITTASNYIENYCNRVFGASNYTEYKNGYGDGKIITNNYPINKITGVATQLYNGPLITVSGAVYSLSYNLTNISLELTVTEFDGTEDVNELLFADYHTLDELVTAISALDHLSAQIVDAYEDEPCFMLQPDNGLIVGGNSDYLYFFKVDNYIKFKIDSESDNIVILSDSSCRGINNVMIKYNAGYTEPVDNALHTALEVVGNVPAVLTSICNNFAQVILNQSSDGSKYDLQSERLGDYGYAKVLYDGKIPSIYEIFLNANKSELDKFKRKILTW